MLMYIITVFDADVYYERMLTTIMLMILRQRHRNLWEQQGSCVQILQFPSTHKIENTAGANPIRRMVSLSYLFIYLFIYGFVNNISSSGYLVLKNGIYEQPVAKHLNAASVISITDPVMSLLIKNN